MPILERGHPLIGIYIPKKGIRNDGGMTINAISHIFNGWLYTHYIPLHTHYMHNVHIYKYYPILYYYIILYIYIYIYQYICQCICWIRFPWYKSLSYWLNPQWPYTASHSPTPRPACAAQEYEHFVKLRRNFLGGDNKVTGPGETLQMVSMPCRQKSLFSSSDPHPDTLFWHSFWHTMWKYTLGIYSNISINSIWHSFWHIHSHTFWHSIWHLFLNTFWHISWHSFWHSI